MIDALTALGCVFWLIPLASAVWLVKQYGFYDRYPGFQFDMVMLLGIPTFMLALTIALGWLAMKRQAWPSVIVGLSAVSACAAVYWLAILGQGV